MAKKTRSMQVEEEENEINLTPMLDVVFIMLIFFIVTATFIKEAGIQVERPDTVTADSQDDASILIAISPNDEIWIDRQEKGSAGRARRHRAPACGKPEGLDRDPGRRGIDP